MRFVLGIDIGGTNLVVGSVAENGSALLASDSEPTHAEAGTTDVLVLQGSTPCLDIADELAEVFDRIAGTLWFMSVPAIDQR